MVVVREPVLKPVAIADLRPTQITVGLREVSEKRQHWQKLADKKKAEFLGRHMIPVILGRNSVTMSWTITTWPVRCTTREWKMSWWSCSRI